MLGSRRHGHVCRVLVKQRFFYVCDALVSAETQSAHDGPHCEDPHRRCVLQCLFASDICVSEQSVHMYRQEAFYIFRHEIISVGDEIMVCVMILYIP